MKNYIFKRQGVLQLLALLLVGASVFTKDPLMKFSLLAAGITGLGIIYAAKNQYVVAAILAMLLIVTGYLSYSRGGFIF